MKTIYLIPHKWVSLAALLSFFFAVANSTAAPVTVSSLGIHYGGNVQYTYRVTNNTPADRIYSFSVGNSGPDPHTNPNVDSNTQPELVLFPLNSYDGPPNTDGDQIGLSERLGGLFNNPAGWGITIQRYEEAIEFSLDWSLLDSPTNTYPLILPSQTLTFGVTVPQKREPNDTSTFLDVSYSRGHFTVGFDNFGQYTGFITKLDTTPPALTVTLTPATFKANGGMMAVNATINVKDNYDPAPEIKLVSVTSSNPAPNDVQGAALGTDDRQFSVLAKPAVGVPPAPTAWGRFVSLWQRIAKPRPIPKTYTVVYSATDGSGNTSQATATITITP